MLKIKKTLIDYDYNYKHNDWKQRQYVKCLAKAPIGSSKMSGYL